MKNKSSEKSNEINKRDEVKPPAASCPACGSYSVTATTKPDDDGGCEYVCDDCGEYFVDSAPKGDKGK